MTGLRSSSRPRPPGLPPAEFVDERLHKGEFQSAAIDVNIGLDPDLYAPFASTQATQHGLEDQRHPGRRASIAT